MCDSLFVLKCFWPAKAFYQLIMLEILVQNFVRDVKYLGGTWQVRTGYC